ncbi:merlin-like isoform X2 [Dysidea avara]|uniref:merlin-like isoform X2 n=1 Tax=Dysidea avara TaxID=196820 RepID=UPI003326B3F9
MPKILDVRVSTMDADLEFTVDGKSTGQELFDMVARTVGLREVWYFGLRYVDEKGFISWLRPEKKLTEHCLPREQPNVFFFRAKFYPEDVSDELVQVVTQYLFFLQVKQQILDEEIYCSPEASVLLASYAVQVKYGDYDEKLHLPGFLLHEQLLPPRVQHQYQMTPEMWEEKIVSWYKEHCDMLREETIMEYLKIAQDLEMYGVNYFEIKNKKGTDLRLGVDAQGLNVYEWDDRLSPKISFPWSEIRNVSFQDKKVTIKPIDKKSPDFLFFVPNNKINKLILQLCHGNHDLYMRRRRRDSMEVQQMKAQSREERARWLAERELLIKERRARQEAEREKEELMQRLKQYEREAKDANDALSQSEQRAAMLEEKVKVAEEEAQALARKSHEAEEEIRRARESAVKSEEEKLAMQQRVFMAEEKSRSISQTSDERAREAQRLQQELEEARKAEQYAKGKLMQLTSTGVQNISILSQSPAQSQDNIGASPKLPTEQQSGNNQDDDVEALSKELEEERKQYRQKSQYLAEQLTMLKSQMEVLKVEDQMTRDDILHEENLKKGQNKYSTLRKIKSGSTEARISFFEQL